MCQHISPFSLLSYPLPRYLCPCLLFYCFPLSPLYPGSLQSSSQHISPFSLLSYPLPRPRYQCPCPKFYCFPLSPLYPGSLLTSSLCFLLLLLYLPIVVRHLVSDWLNQCLIQDKISTSPPCAVESRRAGVAKRGRRAARSSNWVISFL